MTWIKTSTGQEWSSEMPAEAPVTEEPVDHEAAAVEPEPEAMDVAEGEKLIAGPLVLLLSGPNLNLLGEREPEIYGTDTLDDHVARAETAAVDYGLVFEHYQSNHEGQLVDAVHGARERASAIIVNAGALTHYAWSLHDALGSFDGYVVELHLSNPNAREPWRQTSVIAPVAHGTISGFGGLGYELAIEAVARLLS
ncbi:MAG TPA: type II 3-dehydroquinate dehydratase [Acidimicrobiales bacterium]|nr:type II 3-dehydroquinate dehydratase [Acidimicrobiales bacterium]